LHQAIRGFAQTIAEQPVQLLPQVAETLQYLAGRHRLILVTKGDFAEQSGKIERSGLKHYFSAVEVVADKTIPAYHEVVGKHKLAGQSTWMVGNSPKSDINPALGAGINAVFVPHDDTWILEHEELVSALPPRRLLVLTAFAELTQHF
jgi:putative hydrolase of the HAD superfamily